ncbi:hypothetical protein G6F64_015482 [Rhizopus arrhizus]|uniref:Secreted protein n=1 Tax=Rhizopus oryzae TaxID=64495 RepID=A0A9P7BIL8_RHIOR|nr:hypothetical protein G6F64_015482 [Rhizopus arrhizus]
MLRRSPRNSIVATSLGLSTRTWLALASSGAGAPSASVSAWPTRRCTWRASQVPTGGASVALPASSAGALAASAACCT